LFQQLLLFTRREKSPLLKILKSKLNLISILQENKNCPEHLNIDGIEQPRLQGSFFQIARR
jgi:hypothetical protein